MEAKGSPVQRMVNDQIEFGYVRADDPMTVFFSEDCTGGHYGYPDTETMERAGWSRSAVTSDAASDT